ncbi:MAG: protein phosphatase 2C domain-containing protein [Bifidobacteriaceae bacterium]|jgi:protein phosphatase|nr:protein phosphatase 2C domain-containing protein [Bifidobacteriaceae bacterium]
MALTFDFAARTDIGLTRSNNQDSAYAGPHLLAVADGMGGHAGGDIASSVAIAHLAPLDDEAPGADEAAQQINQVVSEAHAELLERVAENPDLAGLGTTITALLRTEDRLVLAHIGDSRAYLLHDGELSQVTTDHTFVQYLVETGKLEPEQAERHPQRSLLLRVLGDVDLGGGLDMSIRTAQAGDRWMLCSDGLTGVVAVDTIHDVLASEETPDGASERLIELALRGGGPDNVTCVVGDIVDLEKTHGEPPATAVQVVGAAAIDRDRPTRGSAGAAGKAQALSQGAKARTAHATGTDEAAVKPAPRHRRGLRAALTALIAVIVVAGAVTAGYRWTQSQYYVGQADGNVAIFRGIDQTIGPLSLSHRVQTTAVSVQSLPQVSRQRLAEGLPAGSLKEAEAKLNAFLADAGPASLVGTSPTPSAPSVSVAPVGPGQVGGVIEDSPTGAAG